MRYIHHETDRQTDRHADTTEIIYHAAFRVVNNLCIAIFIGTHALQ